MARPLGQHFLNHPGILKRIVDVADVRPEDLVVEFGAGKGSLTAFIAERGCRVIAIELDRTLYRVLRERFRFAENVEILREDIMRFDLNSLPPYKIVSNIPYYITTPIIFRLLEEGGSLLLAVLTVQKEVAERIIAPAGSKRYGVLSVMVQMVADAEIAFYIPKGLFVPPPKVDSAVLKLTKRASPRVPVSDMRLFKKVVKTAFRQRRKYIANSLKGLISNPKDLLNDIGITPTRRPETLTIEEFARIAEAIQSRREEPSP